MHECPDCYQACDCDGEDLEQPAPADHRCINPDCGRVDGGDDFEDEAPPAAGGAAQDDASTTTTGGT